jgi:hypothetical protein
MGKGGKSAEERRAQLTMPDGSVVSGTFAELARSYGAVADPEHLDRDARDQRAEIAEMLRPWAGHGAAVFETVKIVGRSKESWDVTVDARPPTWLWVRLTGAVARATTCHSPDDDGWDLGALARRGMARCLEDPHSMDPKEHVTRTDLFHILFVLMGRHPNIAREYAEAGRDPSDYEVGELPETFREGVLNSTLWLFEGKERLDARIVHAVQLWMKRAAATVLLREEAGLSVEHAMAAKKRMSQAVRLVPKVGRNTRCPCDSGRKFKKCCGRLA